MRIVVERDVAVPRRDGTTGFGDLYRIEGRSPRPTLLHRTPYGKADQGAGKSLDTMRLVEAGFNVFVEDVRGRYRSPGRFAPYEHEQADGADTIAWLGLQPWSQPGVGMVGRSYGGATQWLAATGPGPRPAAIAPDVSGIDFYDPWTYQGGVFQLGFCLHWALADLAYPDAADGGEVASMVDGIEDVYREPWRALALLDAAAPYVRTWIEHPYDDGFWQSISPGRALDRRGPPSLNIGGWHDIFVAGTVRAFEAARDLGGPARLVIGPWSHLVRGGVFPQRRYGWAADADVLDVTGMHVDWFGHHLGHDLGPASSAPAEPVLLFVTGVDEWRAFAQWPPADAAAQALYLHSGGRANSRHGDGGLSSEAPGDESPDAIRHDPAEPVPTTGGATLMAAAAVAGDCGPQDQRPVEERSDVLCFTGPPLQRETTVIGWVVLEVFAASTAQDADVAAKLVDVHPDGRAENVCDGIQRASLRESPADAVPLTPGEVVLVTVQLGPVAHVFRPGHAVRLEVAGSNFPKFALNPGVVGEPWPLGRTPLHEAVHTVWHSARFPSRLVLPVCPSEAG